MAKKSKNRDLQTQQGTVSGYIIKYLPLTVREMRGGTLTQDPKIVVALEVRRKDEEGNPQRPVTVQCPHKERFMKGVDPTPEVFQEVNADITAAYPVNSVCSFTEVRKVFRNREDEEFPVTRYRVVE